MAKFLVKVGDVLIEYENPSDTEVANKFKDVLDWLKVDKELQKKIKREKKK